MFYANQEHHFRSEGIYDMENDLRLVVDSETEKKIREVIKNIRGEGERVKAVREVISENIPHVALDDVHILEYIDFLMKEDI